MQQTSQLGNYVSSKQQNFDKSSRLTPTIKNDSTVPESEALLMAKSFFMHNKSIKIMILWMDFKIFWNFFMYIAEFKECFFFHARRGHIGSEQELSLIMRSLGCSPTAQEVSRYYSKYATGNHSNTCTSASMPNVTTLKHWSTVNMPIKAYHTDTY